MRLLGEIFLSELYRKHVLAPDGERVGRVGDFVVVRGDVFPVIESFVLSAGGERLKLPFAQIEVLNRRVILCRQPLAPLARLDPAAKEVLAVRDIWDKQIVDITGAKIVRVNDVKVREIEDRLCLIAVDVGVRGLMRRLGLKRNDWALWRKLVRRVPYDLISWQYIQPLEGDITRLTLTVSNREMQALHPYEIADVLTRIPPDNQETLIETLGIDKAAEAIPEMDERHQKELLERMDESKAADLMEAMSPDDAADILGDLTESKAEAIIEEMQDEEAEEVKELLRHEEDSAGGLMTTDYLAVGPDLSVAETLEVIRKASTEIENIHVVYVQDKQERLIGYLPIIDLFSHPGDARLHQFMNPRVKSVRSDCDDMEAARIMAKYNLLSLPVVGDDQRLLGIITVDDTLEVLLPALKTRSRYKKK
jgi:CBS domain-containing protein/sporulation protein YlmC with PRC-barrel domain